jgi:hypothetical protein
MFGYIVANSEILSETDKARYKACYCGLCRSLKKRHGQLGRLTLTYDMTFLVLVLTSLYEPSQLQSCERCYVHPMKKHNCSSSDITDYAADMNVALAYLNLLDDWHDDKNLFSLFRAKLLKKKYEKISAAYPRQCGAMRKCLRELSDFESSGEQNPDTAAKIFGRLMGEIFVWRENDRWAPILRDMAESLGEFIYIMDAVCDLERDERKGSYNPLVASKKAGRGDEYFREVLTMLIGECCMEFDKLPLVDDIEIMRNILCSGVWTKYELHMAKKAKRKVEKRP